MMMHGAFMLFLSLSLGYILCVVANKQQGLLKTVGFALGIAILALSLVAGLISSYGRCAMMSKMCSSMGKTCPMMKGMCRK